MQNKGAAGVDGQKAEQYLRESPQRLEQVQDMLRTGQYTPQPVKRVWIPKLGSKELRPLGVPAVEDRVVQTAVRNVIEPIFENLFAEHSYGFRPRRGAKDALRRVDQLLDTGKVWVVDADLKGYFDSIPQDKMMEAVAEHIADGPLLELIQRFLQARSHGERQRMAADGTGDAPRGGHQPAAGQPLPEPPGPSDGPGRAGRWCATRTTLSFCARARRKPNEVLAQLRQWVAGAGLTLHPTKTRIVNASEKGGFDFLGYHFERGHRWPRQKSLDKFRETIRQKTGRLRPGSMGEIIGEVNRTMRGWFEYFKHSIKNVFDREDQWIRGRLRAILRKRHKGHGRARGHRPSTLAQCLLRRTGAILLSHSPSASDPISQENPLTGKPDAGNPPVRFGGRGGVQTLVPTPIDRDGRAPRTVKIVGLGEDLGAREV